MKRGKTYLLMLETRAANGFSQAYIFMILIPDTTSFIVRILLSVSVAVLLLKTKNIRQVSLWLKSTDILFKRKFKNLC